MRMRLDWSLPLRWPLTIPDVMTLKTVADVQEPLGHISKERRALLSWRHVEKTLQRCLSPTSHERKAPLRSGAKSSERSSS